ncbi:transcriptional regulator, TetR family [Spongiibacter sp. IMCC21906]|uniref:TetR/AcrR family transcriptional regulator n=1 Tax=Spongiibacter sp. IMCC21906 TaxID=1620392 RepID=UPI00062DFEC6|nr:TetR/AcrR family transcriptional regulator [Spongiibacter sp. IMCC21906]AKH68272.1 transcriptional regulator, TetR family [Spongiibacter sp. IMCC21906]
MKTREKILLTSLALFNNEGEPSVTTVDIANELDISPGNLYYHFHGKEEIIAELFDAFELELRDILGAPSQKSISAQDAWFYLYIVYEQIFNHRYLYRNLNDLLQRYPEISRRFNKLLDLKVNAARAVMDELLNQGFVEISETQLARLCDSIALNLTFWLNYSQLREHQASNEILIHQGVFQLMSLVAPYLRPEFRYFYDESCALFEALVQSE